MKNKRIVPSCVFVLCSWIFCCSFLAFLVAVACLSGKDNMSADDWFESQVRFFDCREQPYEHWTAMEEAAFLCPLEYWTGWVMILSPALIYAAIKSYAILRKENGES